MTRGELATVGIANALVVTTGVVYAVMRYLMEPADEWAVVNHPWQPHVQHLHVLAVPALVFAIGLLWGRHVIHKLRNGSDGRTSGIGLLVAFMPMAASGYLLQVSVRPEWRSVWIAVHIAASILWIVAFAAHQMRFCPGRNHADSEAVAPATDDAG